MRGLRDFINENSNVWDKCVNHIRKYKNVADIYNKWETFSVEEQLQMLEESGFVGFVYQNDIDNECIVYLITLGSKDELLMQIDQELDNRKDGNNVDDTNHYVVKYRGKDKPLYTSDEFLDKNKLPRTNIEWICSNEGETIEKCWYASSKAKNDMIDYMGLVEFSEIKHERITYGHTDWN